MSKSKNHTNHNQNKKAHRNGIKKPVQKKSVPGRFRDAKVVRNERAARKGMVLKKKEAKEQK